MDSQVKCLIAIVLGMTVGVLSAVLGLLWSIPDIPNAVPNNIYLPKTVNAEGGINGLTCGNVAGELHNYVLQSIANQNRKLEQDEKEDERKRENGYQHKLKVKPAASVFGLLEHKGRRTGNLVHWNINSPNSFQRGVHYGRGFLEIKQSGYYYIFSQIKFRSHPRHSVFIPVSFNPDISRDYKTDSDDDMTHKHYMLVLSQSSETERILLESYKSTCGLSEVREFTSAVGAVFYLNENDKLLVRTSPPQYLVACNHTNNFGVYMI